MAKSIKINFIYNVINTVSGLVFPLIAYPYAFRILLSDGIGTVNFLNSIIAYVTLLSGIGIPLYGIREIARVRDCKEDLSKTTIEILSLNLLLNVIGYSIVLILNFSVAELRQYSGLFLLLSSSIILTTLGCQWFYTGTEDFKFITIRGIIVRIICTLFLFLSVKTKDDLYYYALYIVLVSSGNYIINFLCLKSRISLETIKIKELNLKRHIKPAFAVFVLNLITSIYVNLDKVMLGFLQDTESVGYYTAATQISHIFLTLVVALGTVMLPRSSNLIKQGKFDEFYRLASKSYHVIIMLAIPICVGCMVMSPVLINVICGEDYEPSILTLRIICPIVLAIGMSNLIGLQMLYPLGLIKFVTISTAIGASVNIILNICLIPFYSENGAAIATLIAEVSVTVSQLFMAYKYIKFKLISLDLLKYLFSAFLMGIVCTYCMNMEQPDMLKLLFIPIVGVIVYGILLLFMRDPLLFEVFNLIKIRKRL